MLYRTRIGCPSAGRRPAVAAVEFAVVSLFLVPLLLGLWEVGRLVEVQQYLTNAAREGGRQASTARKDVNGVKNDIIQYCAMNGITVQASEITITNPDNASYQTDGTGKYLSDGATTPNKFYIKSDVNGDYVTDPKAGNAKVYVSVNSTTGDASGVDPVAFSNLVANNKLNTDSNPKDANQLDRLQITIKIPFNRVRWILLQQITPTQNLTAYVEWRCMRDVPLSVNTTLPLQ